MKKLSLLFSVILVATATAESLRLVLVPQQIVVSGGASPMKFDLYLYNATNSAQMVPSLESFRALYVVRSHTNSEPKLESYWRKFSQPIKDHTLKAQRVDHTVIEIDLSSEDADYIELRIEIGDQPTLTSNTVLLLCSPVSASPVESPSSPKAAVTPK
jgi:hypothetical protein